MSPVLIIVGLFAGTVAALLGVGGGIIYIPALVFMLGLSQHVAQGTSLAVIAPTALVATYVHHRGGRVAWGLAIPVSIGAALGALAGASLALEIEGDTLKKMFAVLLATLSILMWRKPDTDANELATTPQSEHR